MKCFVILFLCGITELCWSATVMKITENPAGGELWNGGSNVTTMMGLKSDIYELRLVYRDPSQTSRGSIMSKYQQYAFGYEVQTCHIILEHFSANGTWSYFAKGKLVKGCEEDNEPNLPNLTETEISTIALQAAHFDANSDKTDIDPHDKHRFMLKIQVENAVCEVVYVLKFVVVRPGGKGCTDYQDYRMCQDQSEIKMKINGKNGRVISYDHMLETYMMKGDGGNINIGKYRYGEGRWWSRLLDTTQLDNKLCEMQNPKTLTASAQGADIFPINSCFNQSIYSPYTECCDPETSTDPTSTTVSQVHDAHYFATRFQEMLFELFGDTTLPDCCGQVWVCVHLGTEFGIDNAFYYNTGHCETYFGDGLKYVTGMAVADIVAHELGHGIIECTSGLEYECQSGAIDEAFADMCGVMFKAFLYDYRSNFLFGEAVINNQSIFKDALRYMDDPPRDGRSIDCAQDYECQNVHFSSGVYNKAFYNLVMNEHWSFRTAYEIFLRATKIYWHPLTGFDEGLCGLIQSAYDLGYSGDDVREAFAKVGVYCTCPEGWHTRQTWTDSQGNGCKTCYKFVHVLASWAEARDYCQAMQSDLVTLENQWNHERDWVYEGLTNVSSEYMMFCRYPDYWIGGMDMSAEGNWHWIPTDQPIKINETDWMTGEPDNFLGNQHCAALSNHQDEWKWIDDDCVRKKFFICEMSCYGVPART